MSDFIRPSSDGKYYGMVMSVHPGLRPSVTVFRIFRAQEPKAPVTYCDHALSGVRPSVVR